MAKWLLRFLPAWHRFTTEDDLHELGMDSQQRLRLRDALPAVAKQCIAQGRLEGAAAIVVYAGEGGGGVAPRWRWHACIWCAPACVQPWQSPKYNNPPFLHPPYSLQPACQTAPRWRH